jgi:hypothetical protein
MAINIRIDGGFQIEKTFFYGYTYTHNALINLAPQMGSEMSYDSWDKILIDYPGEYDIQGWTILVLRGRDDKLSYFIQKGNKQFWIIATPDVLEQENALEMSTWLFSDNAVTKKLDQLEMEGERINLEEYRLNSNREETPTP